MGTTFLTAGILGVHPTAHPCAALPTRFSRGHIGFGVAVRPRLTVICFIMADNSFALFPVAELLLALGARPGKTRNTFHSPFREDKNASLHIDPRRNVWFDHGAGIGGGNIDLVMKCRDCSAREAVDFILSLSPSDPATQVSSGNEKTPGAGLIPEVKPLSSRIVAVRELRSPYLLDYAASRGIPEKIAARY